LTSEHMFDMVCVLWAASFLPRIGAMHGG
jgi:hypothetical protein